MQSLQPLSANRYLVKLSVPAQNNAARRFQPALRTSIRYYASQETSSQRPDLGEKLQGEGNASTSSKSKFGPERIGPFPMGVGGSMQAKKWAPWKDLDIGGKIVRSTAQTGNLTVVLFGGALFVVLAYTLSTELFSRNSPTVLLNEAIDMVEDSEVMDLHLLRPYAFTHLPSPTSSRRSSPVQSQVVRNPETGNDHLIMRFWIHGRGLDEPNTTTGWLKARWREGKIWVKQAVREMGSDSLEGQTVVNEGDRSVTTTVKPQEEQGWFSSLFGALRPSLPRTQTMGTPKKNLPPAGTYRSAEGRVDFFRNPETEAYEMLTLTVDVPGGRRPNQRAVLHWSEPGQVAEEGILEGKRHKITF